MKIERSLAWLVPLLGNTGTVANRIHSDRLLQDRKLLVESCMGTAPQQYESTVLIKHTGKSFGLTDADIATLEDSFQIAWNSLYCHINITDVIVDRNNLQEMENDEFQLPYKVIGRCDVCLDHRRGALFGYTPYTDDGLGILDRSGNSRRGRRRQAKKTESQISFYTSEAEYHKTSSSSSDDNGGLRRFPLESVMMEGFNQELAERRSGLTGNYTAMELVEAKPFSCSPDESQFINTFLLELNGEPSLDEMGENFMEIYNMLVFFRCDDQYFRQMRAVAVDQLPNGHNKWNNMVRVAAETSCRGCETGSVDIFRNSSLAYRRELSDQALLVALQPPQRQIEFSSQCYCSAKNPYRILGVPTIEMFLSQYNDKLIESNASSVEQYFRVEELPCNASEDLMQTTMIIEIDRFVGALDKEDMEKLATSFQATFNAFFFDLCDEPYFRRVGGVNLENANQTWLGKQAFPSWLDKTRLLKMTIEYSTRFEREALFEVGHLGTNAVPAFDMTVPALSQEVQPYDGSCFCPFQGSLKPLPISPTIFKDVYNAASGGLDVGGLNHLLEVQEYSCDANPTEQTTKLFILFDSDIQDSTLLTAIETDMTLIYNNLNFKTCDNPHFRRATNVSLSSKGEATSNTTGSVYTGYVFEASVAFECRNCDEIPSLLSWRDELTVEIADLNLTHVNPDASDSFADSCYCPINARTEDRAPTEMEFELALARSISQPPVGVQSLVEVHELDCPYQRYGFQTEVYLRLNIDSIFLSEIDRVSIEAEFKHIYNLMNFLYCDSMHYRKVLQVSLEVPSSTQRRQQEEDDYSDEITNSTSNYVRAVVDVECRQCFSDTTLFSGTADNTSELSSPFSMPSSTLLSMIANGELEPDSCFCSSTSPVVLGRAPTTSEFLRYLSFSASDVQESTTNTTSLVPGFVETVEEVIEVRPVECR
jgi:hypothetical protein